MIDSLYNRTCQILSRIDSSIDSWNHYEYTPGIEIGCLYKEASGRKVINAAGADVIISGILTTTVEIKSTDRVLFDAYEWEVVSISPKEDLLTGEVLFYVSSLIKREVYIEKPITIS